MATNEQIVYNHDVVGAYNRINRFIEEMVKSVSGGVSQMNSFDVVRLKSYLDAVDRHHDWVVAQPQLDLPETAPRAYALEVPPATPDVENEDVNDLVRLFVLTRDELTNSQSSRQGSGFIGFDSVRLRAIITKARAFLTSYVEVVQPLDLPESSPKELVSGPGHGGV